MKIFLLGSLAFDEVGQFKGHFKELFDLNSPAPFSLSFIAEDSVESLGGCSGNVAYGLGLLGVPAYLCGLLGSDGDSYASTMESWGMDLRFLGRGSLKTARAVITSDLEGAQIAHFNPGILASESVFELPSIATEEDLILVGPENKSRMIQAADQAREKKMRLFLDPGQLLHVFTSEELLKWIDGAEALFFNEFEWQLFQERTHLKEDELLKRVKLLVVTLGKEGVRLHEGPNSHLISSFPANFKDGTGAGDAFRAGFLAALAVRLDYLKAAEWGVILGSAAVESPFAQSYQFNADRALALKKHGWLGALPQ